MYRLARNVACCALAIIATNNVQVTAHDLGDFGQYLCGVTKLSLTATGKTCHWKMKFLPRAVAENLPRA
jgi:hypothetical protein